MWCCQTNIFAGNHKEWPTNFIHLEGISGSRRLISEGHDFSPILKQHSPEVVFVKGLFHSQNFMKEEEEETEEQKSSQTSVKSGASNAGGCEEPNKTQGMCNSYVFLIGFFF